MLNQREKDAFLSFLEESGLDKDEEPPKSSGLRNVFKEIISGFKKQDKVVLES